MKNDYLKLGRMDLVLVCMMCAVIPGAAMHFTIDYVKATPGQEVDVVINLTNEQPIKAIVMSVDKPNGFEVTEVKLGNRIKVAHNYFYKYDFNYYYSFFVMKDDQTPLITSPGSGSIVTMTFSVPPEANGTYTVNFSYEVEFEGSQEPLKDEGAPFTIICPENAPAGALKVGDTFTRNGIYYRVNGDKTVEVTYRDEGYNSYRGKVTVPPSVNYGNVKYTVNAIGERAFLGCSSLIELKLPNTIKTIRKEAIMSCKSLTEVNLPEGLTMMSDRSLDDIPLIKSLVIPSTLTQVSKLAFRRLPGLMHIEVASGNPVFDSRRGCNAIISTESNELVVGCVNTVIPNDVEMIGEYAFSGCPITGIDIPHSVRVIGESAFSSTALRSVFFHRFVTNIYGDAFYNCKELESVSFAGPTDIAKKAFSNCTALKSVSLLGSPAQLWASSFDEETYNNAILYTIKKDMSTLATDFSGWKRLFKHIQLKCYDYYDNGVYYLRHDNNELWVTFKDENYNSYPGGISLPSNVYIDGRDYVVTTIRSNAFLNCKNLTYVQLPKKNLTIIDAYAIENCTSLEKIHIPDGKEPITLFGLAFKGCTNLKTVDLGKNCSMSSMMNIFYSCNKITSVTCMAPTPPVSNSSNFSKTTYQNATLYVPRTSLKAYRSDPTWSLFKKIVGITEDTSIKDPGYTPPADGESRIEVAVDYEGEAMYENGRPLSQGVRVNDHLFVRQDGQPYNEVTMSGEKGTFVKIWLDDNQIYSRRNVQDLVFVAKDGEGGYYDEVTYSGVTFDLYLPMNIELDQEQLAKGERMPFKFSLHASPQIGTKEIKGKTYKVHKVIAQSNTFGGSHFSAQTISDYHANGALMRDDGYLLGIRIKNTDPNVDPAQNDDFIIANVEFVVQEAQSMNWPEKERRFIYSHSQMVYPNNQLGAIVGLYQRVKLVYE